MRIFNRNTFSVRPGEVAALATRPTDDPYLPENIDLTVVLAPHETIDDFKPVSERLDGSDVFIPEVALWTDEGIELFSRISQGDRKALREYFRRSEDTTGFLVAKLRKLFASKVYVTPIDIPRDDPKASQIHQTIEDRIWSQNYSHILDADFLKTLDNIISYARRFALENAYREDVMARSIGPRLESLIKEQPGLKAKKPVKVVVQLGTDHTLVTHQFAKMAAKSHGTIARRAIYPNTITFYPLNRLFRHFQLGDALTTEEQRLFAAKTLGSIGIAKGEIAPPINKNEIGNLPSLATVSDRLGFEDAEIYHQYLMDSEG